MNANVQKSKNDKYDKIINRTDELRKEAQELKQETSQNNDDETTNKLPIRTFITGYIKGKIIDLDYIEGFRTNKLKINVRISTGDVVEIYLKDTGEYEEKNELGKLYSIIICSYSYHLYISYTYTTFLRVANNIRIQYKKYMNKDALKK
jgi:hypothetical protein